MCEPVETIMDITDMPAEKAVPFIIEAERVIRMDGRVIVMVR